MIGVKRRGRRICVLQKFDTFVIPLEILFNILRGRKFLFLGVYRRRNLLVNDAVLSPIFDLRGLKNVNTKHILFSYHFFPSTGLQRDIQPLLGTLCPSILFMRSCLSINSSLAVKLLSGQSALAANLYLCFTLHLPLPSCRVESKDVPGCYYS